MILNYKFENFMSFRENVEFSMLAPKTKVKNRFPNNFITSNVGVDVLKTAVVVGENAGGKSNFVRSLSYLQSFFLETESPKAYKSVINTNNKPEFCPKKSNTLQTFEIEALVKGNTLYLYHLEVDFMGIVKEAFYFKNQAKNKYKIIFSMERNDCMIECENEDDCINANECRTRIKVKYFLQVPESEHEIEKYLEKATNKGQAPGLTITKLAMLGNEHAITFTEWIKNAFMGRQTQPEIISETVVTPGGQPHLRQRSPPPFDAEIVTTDKLYAVFVAVRYGHYQRLSAVVQIKFSELHFTYTLSSDRQTVRNPL